MKALILHLSDIHFKDEGNSVLKKKEHISTALQNLTHEMDLLFMVISGDIASSGKQAEYDQAVEFLDSIKTNTECYSKKKLNCIMIPGNHDCNHNTQNIKAREILIKGILDNGYKAIDEGVIDQCCEVQSNFFDFASLYQDVDNMLYSNRLLSIFEYKFDRYSIVFHCYNTSWISQKHEKYGNIYSPVKIHPKEHFDHKSDTTVSILHHPFHWQRHENRRDLKIHIEKTSDIVLTGHEHIPSKTTSDDFEGHYAEYIEGGVLQESNEDEDSAFNVILLDLKNDKQRIYNYEWNGERYTLPNTLNEWIPYKRDKRLRKRTFEINQKFEETLNDPGASFAHPHKHKLALEDFFIYPNLRDLKIDTAQDVLDDILDSDILLDINENKNSFLLVGVEQSGRSSLCKMLYKHYYNNDYVPVYIEGHRIRSASFEDFNKLVSQCYVRQYSESSLEEFNQLSNGKKLLIMDDFDKSRLNTRYRSDLLKSINEFYPNVIIAANDLFRILVGAKVKVTLEIEAEVPSGAPDQVIRTVTENSRTLKFTSQGFEKE